MGQIWYGKYQQQPSPQQQRQQTALASTTAAPLVNNPFPAQNVPDDKMQFVGASGIHHQPAARIELLIRLVICTHTPFIQSTGMEIAIYAQQQHAQSVKSHSSNSMSNGLGGKPNSGCSQFQVLFDRYCAVSAIEGESVDEIIPDALDFAYDFKNLPLIFDGAFTRKFGRMAQIRPRSVEVEHGQEVTVVFHLKDHHQQQQQQQQQQSASHSRPIANIESARGC